MQNQRGLYRSRDDSVIGGVAGGLAQYWHMDSTILRVVFLLVTLFGGGGLILYIILWIAIPLEPVDFIFSDTDNNHNNSNMEEEKKQNANDQKPPFEPEGGKTPLKNDGNLIAGLILITIGTIFLLDRFVPRLDFGDLWPVILLVAGIFLIRSSLKKSKNQDQ